MYLDFSSFFSQETLGTATLALVTVLIGSIVFFTISQEFDKFCKDIQSVMEH